MDPTSQSLLVKASGGSGLAWERLVDLYRPLIGRWLRVNGIGGHDLDDLTQDILITLIKELPRYIPSGRPGAFRAWLRVITTNRARLFWRTRPDRAGPGLDRCGALADGLADPDSDLSRRWDREHDSFVVRRLLEIMEGEFEPATMTAFRRLTLDGHSPAAVAAELGMSVGAVYVAKSRVLSRLRGEGQGILD